MSIHDPEVRLELVTLAGDVTVLANSPEGIHAAAADPQTAHRIAVLQKRNREVLEAASAAVSAAVDPGRDSVTAAGQTRISPEDFRRRVRLRRRMEALKKRRQVAAAAVRDPLSPAVPPVQPLPKAVLSEKRAKR